MVVGHCIGVAVELLLWHLLQLGTRRWVLAQSRPFGLFHPLRTNCQIAIPSFLPQGVRQMLVLLLLVDIVEELPGREMPHMLRHWQHWGLDRLRVAQYACLVPIAGQVQHLLPFAPD